MWKAGTAIHTWEKMVVEVVSCDEPMNLDMKSVDVSKMRAAVTESFKIPEKMRVITTKAARL